MKTTRKMLAAIRPQIHRLASAMARRYRGLIDLDDARSLAELGALEAWRKRRLLDANELSPYAASWARGRVLAHVRRELRHRDPELLGRAQTRAPERASPEVRAEATRLLERLNPQERHVLIRYACGRDSLAQVAREANRHRAWGSRTLASALAHLRDSPYPPGSRPR